METKTFKVGYFKGILREAGYADILAHQEAKYVYEFRRDSADQVLPSDIEFIERAFTQAAAFAREEFAELVRVERFQFSILVTKKKAAKAIFKQAKRIAKELADDVTV